jgi:hypothetical protein
LEILQGWSQSQATIIQFANVVDKHPHGLQTSPLAAGYGLGKAFRTPSEVYTSRTRLESENFILGSINVIPTITIQSNSMIFGLTRLEDRSCSTRIVELLIAVIASHGEIPLSSRVQKQLGQTRATT